MKLKKNRFCILPWIWWWGPPGSCMDRKWYQHRLSGTSLHSRDRPGGKQNKIKNQENSDIAHESVGAFNWQYLWLCEGMGELHLHHAKQVKQTGITILSVLVIYSFGHWYKGATWAVKLRWNCIYDARKIAVESTLLPSKNLLINIPFYLNK